MELARILAYVTGTVDQELLARNEYLATARASLLNITRLRQERLARASAKLKLVSERGRI